MEARKHRLTLGTKIPPTASGRRFTINFHILNRAQCSAGPEFIYLCEVRAPRCKMRAIHTWQGYYMRRIRMKLKLARWDAAYSRRLRCRAEFIDKHLEVEALQINILGTSTALGSLFSFWTFFWVQQVCPREKRNSEPWHERTAAHWMGNQSASSLKRNTTTNNFSCKFPAISPESRRSLRCFMNFVSHRDNWFI